MVSLGEADTGHNPGQQEPGPKFTLLLPFWSGRLRRRCGTSVTSPQGGSSPAGATSWTAVGPQRWYSFLGTPGARPLAAGARLQPQSQIRPRLCFHLRVGVLLESWPVWIWLLKSIRAKSASICGNAGR